MFVLLLGNEPQESFLLCLLLPGLCHLSQTVQQVEGLATNPDYLTSVPGSSGGENQLPQLPMTFDLHRYAMGGMLTQSQICNSKTKQLN